MVLILTVNNLICIGWFIWGGSNFTETANDIQLENTGRGPKLTAYLRKRDGGYRELQGLYLADKIANENGELVFKVCIPPNILLHCGGMLVLWIWADVVWYHRDLRYIISI